MGVEESDQVAMRARETEDNFPVSSGNGHGHAISNDNHSKSSNAGENGGRSEAAEDLDGGAALRVASLDELTQFARYVPLLSTRQCAFACFAFSST